MSVIRILLFSAWIVSSARAMESFDTLPSGALTSHTSIYGKLSAKAGDAEVLGAKGRSGTQAMHIVGGKDRSMSLEFDAPTSEKRMLDFWAERWTSRGGFEMRVDFKQADSGGNWSARTM